MNLRSMTRRCLASVFGLAVVGLAAQAQADTITPVFEGVTGTAGAFTWEYSISQSSNSRLETGVSKFTIYDFRGYDLTHDEPDGWELSTSPLGPTYTTSANVPLGVIDDPFIVNLTWTWTGPPTPAGTNPSALGPFLVGSVLGNQTLSDWASQDVTNGGDFDGTHQVAQGEIETPVPEPSGLLAMGLGLVALSLRRRNR